MSRGRARSARLRGPPLPPVFDNPASSLKGGGGRAAEITARAPVYREEEAGLAGVE